jgi:hypothetical protein
MSDKADGPLGLASNEGLGAGAVARCWCHACRPVAMWPPDDNRMILCPDCGNKRCPKASHHERACTGSNDSGQLGSEYGRDLCAACVTPMVCTRDQRCLVAPW